MSEPTSIRHGLNTEEGFFSLAYNCVVQGFCMKFENLGPSSWACIGGGDDVFHSFGANQGFVAHADSCLLVDSGFHRRTALQILWQVRKFRSKRMMLVNTHYHSDHVFGNNVFTRKGAVVLSHEKCRRSMLKHSESLLAKYRARDIRLSRLLRQVEVSYPSVTYRNGVRVFVGDDFPVDVFHPEGRGGLIQTATLSYTRPMTGWYSRAMFCGSAIIRTSRIRISRAKFAR